METVQNRHNITTEYDLNDIRLRNLLKTIGYYPGDKPELPTYIDRYIYYIH